MSQQQSRELTRDERISDRIDPRVTGALAVSSQGGGLMFESMAEVMEFAKVMAVSGIAVRSHLRGNPGACAAVAMQAIEWGMSPYAVANKSYSVNDQLSYEAQMLHAVVLRRAPIRGRVKVEYVGEAGDRVCRVWAELKDEPGEFVEYSSPLFSKINPKNSPLWKNDPDQQQFYFSVRAWCRRHFPDVILGVYARDELEDERSHVGAEAAKDITPPRGMANKLDALASAAGPTPPQGSASRDEPPPPEEELSQDPADHGLKADAADEDVDAAIAAVLEDLDHRPAGIDTGDLAQVRAYADGLGAAARGMHLRAMPGPLREPGLDDVAECWRKGHAFETKRRRDAEEADRGGR